MRLKSIRLKNYGPIKNLQLQPSNFELIFGLNESGKTALLEALIWLLFKKDPRNLRYGKPENIEIVIEEGENSYILPARKRHLKLPTSNIAGLLYVRASESAVFDDRKTKDNFWDEIKRVMSQMDKGVSLKKLETKIIESVGLTPERADWKENKVQKIKHEKERLETLKSYLERISEIAKNEVYLTRLQNRFSLLKKRLSLVEKAKQYKNYKDLKNLYRQFSEIKSRLQDYERYKYEYQTRWQKLLIEKEGLIKTEKERSRTEAEIENLKRELSELAEKERVIESSGLKKSLGEVSEKKKVPDIRYCGLIFLITVVLLFISFIYAFPRAISIPLFLLGLGQFVYFLYKRKEVRDIQSRREELFNQVKKFFPRIENLDQFDEKVQDLYEERMKKQAVLEEKEKFLKHFVNTTSIEEIEKEIGELRNKTGLAEIGDLIKKIKEKRMLDENLARLRAHIGERLREKNENRWSGIIDMLRVEPPDQKVDIEQEDMIREQVEKLDREIEKMMREMKTLRAIQKSIHNISDDYSAYLEYHRLKKTLENYDLERRAVLKIKEILEKMSDELDQFIEDIVSGDKGLSRYFNLVTGRYDRVAVVNKNFVVYDKESHFELEDLSSGTQDQLLFCFRVAALEKIYPEGFFMLLDDAFIFADWPRRENLVKLLKSCVENGNQIIYLSSDNHTRDLFKEYGAGIIKL